MESNLQAFYDDLFSDLLSFDELYCEIYLACMIYGEWPVSDGV